MKKLGVLFLVGYWISTGVAHAATYYVSSRGNDSYSCVQAQSTSTPMGTIGGGVRCLVAGDTLLVRGGTYAEALVNNVPSGTSWTNKVRIAAYPGETVWLAPAGGDWALSFTGTQQYIEFDGINMRGPAPGSVISFGGESAANHIRVQNAEIVNDNDTGLNGAIGVSHSSNDNEFINLNIHGVGGPYGIYLSGNRNVVDHCDIHNVSGAGIHIYGNNATPTANIVRNTRIHDISTFTFFGTSDSRRWGILISGAGNTIYNNIIYGVTGGNTSANKAIDVWWGSGHKVYNNTVVNNATLGISVDADATNTDVRNNISYGNTGGGQFNNQGAGTTTSNNLFGVDPVFVDASSNNFQLQGTSRAIDAGASLSVVNTDFAGVARPQGSGLDIGAYEYRSQQAQPSAPTAPTGVRIVSN